MRISTLLRFATTGSRQDAVRIVTTVLGAAAGTLALLCALTVAVTGPDDGPYANHLLAEPGLHPGVIVTLVLLGIPLLAFVGQCSRIGAPARDRRLASLRMAGAGPGDVTAIAATESGLAAGAGAVAGLVVYLVGRQLLEHSSMTGDRLVRSLPTDVLPPWWALLAVAAAIPALATLLSAVTLRRVAITPFGILRGQRDVPPRLRSIVLLVIGAGGMGAFATIVELLHLDRRPFPLGSLIFQLLFLLAATGLIQGTATFAAVLGRLLAPRMRRPALLIASRRMIALPSSASRTSSTILLAVLVGAYVEGMRVNVLWSANTSQKFYADTFDLLRIAIAIVVVIAAAGLLVNAAEGIVSRRRANAALVATGTPRAVLARAALAETLLPLLPGVVLAAATGILAARGVLGTHVTHFETRVVHGRRINVSHYVASLPVPWTRLAMLVGGSIAITLLTTAVALLFLRAATDPDELRAAA